jgi:hypothetical protein
MFESDAAPESIVMRKMLLIIRGFQYKLPALLQDDSRTHEIDVHFRLFFSRIIELGYMGLSVDFTMNICECIMNDA